MSTVRVGENENVESALKRFKRKCQKDGVIGDMRKHCEYTPKSVAKKLKHENAIKKQKKQKKEEKK